MRPVGLRVASMGAAARLLDSVDGLSGTEGSTMRPNESPSPKRSLSLWQRQEVQALLPREG